MKFKPLALNCENSYPNTSRASNFRYVQVDVLPHVSKADKELISELLDQASALANQVAKNSANDASYVRRRDRLIRNALAGLLSERAWRLAVNKLTNRETLSSTPFVRSYDQIDLVSDEGKTIEVRSSFPRGGLAFALCHPEHEFDVIGPYTNDYKTHEVAKDIYVRTLFPFDESELLNKLEGDGVEMYLTGGATKEMFENPEKFALKSMTAADDISLVGEGTPSRYKVIPFSKALDTFEVAELLGYKHTEAWSYFDAS